MIKSSEGKERCRQHVSLTNIGEEDTTDALASDLSERIPQWFVSYLKQVSR